MSAAPLTAATPEKPLGTCTEEMLSCAPRPAWDCIHGNIHIEDKCDPASPYCIIVVPDQ